MHSEKATIERWYELFKARCFSLIPRQHIVLLLHDDDDDDSETCEEQRVCKKPNIAQFEN